MQQTVKRGDVYWSRFAVVNGEENKVSHTIRPVLIVSNDEVNSECNSFSVIPISKKLENLNKNCHIMLQLLEPSILLPEQLTMLSRDNLYEKIIHIDDTQLKLVDFAIKKQLGLSINWIRKHFRLILEFLSAGTANQCRFIILFQNLNTKIDFFTEPGYNIIARGEIHWKFNIVNLH